MVKDFTINDDSIKTYKIPESELLFNNQDIAIIIKEIQANIYHKFFDRALFITNREIPFIPTTVAFLRMLVRAPE